MDATPTTARGGRLPPTAAALLLSGGPAVALGFARFAYTLILPPMRQALDWTYATGGAMNTANAVGYLSGAILAAPLSGWIGPRATFQFGISATAIAVLVTPLDASLPWLYIIRAIAGVTSGLTFVAGATLVSGLSERHAGWLLGLYFGGVGTGIMVSALALTPLFVRLGPSAWPYSWYLLGALSLGTAAATCLVSAPVTSPVTSVGSSAVAGRPWSLRELEWVPLIPPAIAYLLFGAGYIGYMTFVIAYLADSGSGPWTVMAFWCLLGGATILSPMLWKGAIDRWRGGRALAGTLLSVAIGSVLPMIDRTLPTLMVSAAAFGAFLCVAVAITADLKNRLPRHIWAAAIAAFTVFFATGQAIGPLVTGWLADSTGGLETGLWVSGGCLLASAAVALLQPPRRSICSAVRAPSIT